MCRNAQSGKPVDGQRFEIVRRIGSQRCLGALATPSYPVPVGARLMLVRRHSSLRHSLSKSGDKPKATQTSGRTAPHAGGSMSSPKRAIGSRAEEIEQASVPATSVRAAREIDPRRECVRDKHRTAHQQHRPEAQENSTPSGSACHGHSLDWT